ncbi:MAG TPA: MtrB/PioB family outer membrane beta-barrel protein [Bryobacteraceae bacterium]|nr:MtrB/PioB family outer membrane beta-barrel protein [Bryobacteraceae bacterium]
MKSLLALLTLVVTVPLCAQDDKPVVLGDFENTGSITAGYRFTSVNGYRPMYQNLFNLNSGFRILDFNLIGRAQAGANTFADDYSIFSNGIGGEPWSTTQLTVRKKKLYELRATFRQSYYYIDPNASAPVPNGMNGLLSDHNWATVRKMGSLNLLVHATNNLKFNFEYSRNTRDGTQDTTRVMDYFGAPSSFGSFQRANPYYLVGLINEETNRVAAGVDYTLGNWSLHYKAGLQRFTDSFTGTSPFSPERSINTSDPATANELLTTAQWSDYHRFSTPVSEFSYNGTLLPGLKASGSYFFFDYSGPASLVMSGAGVGRGATTTIFNPYSFVNNSNARLSEPNHIVDQEFTWDVNDWVSMEAGYKYSRLDLTSNATFTSTSNCCATPALTQSGVETNQWRIGTSTANYDLLVTPLHGLLIRLGIAYMKRDVAFLSDGAADPLTTLRTKTVLPTLSASWQPSKVFSIRANIDEINNGTSYTRETPHTDIGSRIVTRIRPLEKFTIENTTVIRNSKLLTADYTNHVRNNSTTLTYEFNERASGFAGFSYNSFYARSFANFLRGPAPITDVTLTDQNVERLWQAGFNIVPIRRLTVSFAGNYIRVNGLGVVLGEQALYGPMTFPYASASLSWDARKAGKLTVQLQRAYYQEQIITGNNFGADILLLAWTRNF